MDTRYVPPLEDVHAQLRMRAADIALNNSKLTQRFTTEVLYYEVVGFRNDLKNIQKARAAKYPNFVELFELKILKLTGKKSSFQKVKLIELFLNHMNIFSVESVRNPRSIWTPRLTGGTRRSSTDSGRNFFRLLVPRKTRKPLLHFFSV